MKKLVLALVAACGGSPPPKPAPPPPPPAPAPVVAQPEPAKPKSLVPDTPAGKTLGLMLDVFNKGDEAAMKEWATRYAFPDPDMLVPFRTQTGGFDLVSVDSTDRLHLQFVVKEKNSPTQAVGWLRVEDADPAVIDNITLLAVPPDVSVADMKIDIDAATRTRVLDGIAAKLDEYYVYPDVGKKMTEAIRDHAKAGDYDKIVTGPDFAEKLTNDLQAVSHDKHLHVMFEPKVPPDRDDDAKPSPEDEARMRKQMEEMKCGFVKTEKLDGHIGYIKFDMFGPVEYCGPKATEAFAAIDGVDAIIFDLRENGGGHPDMVSFVASYLFGKKTHINDIYERKANKTKQFWTNPDVPGKKLTKQPVYVLTSSRTFSGAEELCYDLQNTKRAVIVGEVTGGGAHPVMGRRIDDHFAIGVPFARAISPITHTDWEGKGIQPDVKVAADQALDTAKELIAKRKKK